MKTHSAYQNVLESVASVRKRLPSSPRVGIVLGSGLGSIADDIKNPVVIPYSEIPHFHPTTIAGHSGKLCFGDLYGVPVVCLQGRFHYYEGHSMDEVVLPTRVLCLLGIQALILTNAAGGINTKYRPGDLMFISDHLNLVGTNPLRGPNISEFGPRFPDLSEAYYGEFVKLLQRTAKKLDIPTHVGVYAGLAGPTFETPAEVRMLRALGADAVGMSTVAECIVARHLGVRVAGISCVTNLAAGLSNQPLSHEEVLELSFSVTQKLKSLLKPTLSDLASLASGGTRTSMTPISATSSGEKNGI